jgi:plastocyanin
LFVGPVLALLALAAPASVGAQGAAPSSSVTVEAGERGAQYFFTPDTLTVPTGQVTITYKNSGLRKHDWAVEALNLSIPEVDAGKSAEGTFTFSAPGTYEFICDLPNHAARGMRGTITVVAAGPAAGAAPQSTAAGGTGGTAAQPTRAATPGTTAGTTAGGAAGGASSAAVAGSAAQGSGSARNVPLFISLAIHVPSAVTWLGIALYDLIVVAAPFLTPAQRGGLLQRPRWAVVALIPLILVTGVYQTINNPFSTLTDFASLEALRTTTTYGQALFFKHGFVLLSWALTLGLSFWVAPQLVAAAEPVAAAGAGTAASPRGRLHHLIAWGNLLACAALVLCVTVMIFQLH